MAAPPCLEANGAFDAAFAEFVDGLESAARTGRPRPEEPHLLGPLCAFLRGGGKRLRPKLMLTAYEGYHGDPAADIVRAAVALELFHGFALIHDDIVDESPRRREGPSLHAALAWIEGSRRGRADGRALAMLAGDVLFALAVRTFMSCNCEPGRKERALDEFMATAVLTGSGAFAEAALRQRPFGQTGQECILEVYERKTALYSFACPLRVGAILAGADGEELGRLGEYGRLLGLAFQMHDDLLDLGSYLDSGQEAASTALSETRMMLPVWLACRDASPGDREWLEALYARDHAGPEDRKRLEALIELSRAPEQTELEITGLLDRASRLGAELAMRPDSRCRLERQVRSLFGPRPQDR